MFYDVLILWTLADMMNLGRSLSYHGYFVLKENMSLSHAMSLTWLFSCYVMSLS